MKHSKQTVEVLQKPNDKFTVAQVAQAMRDAKGIKTAAARILGCNRLTVDRYCTRYPTVAEAARQGESEITDVALGNVVRAILGGDTQESKWWLSKRDPDFKETVRAEVTGANGGPVKLMVVYDDPSAK